MKLQEEAEVLAIQEKYNQIKFMIKMGIKKMNKLWIVLLIGILMSCTAKRKAVETKQIKRELGVTEIREYKYALTEATKQKIFGNFKQADALYRKCIEVNPESDVAYYQLGNMMMMIGNAEEAKKLTRKAVEINEDNFWYNIQLAKLYQIVNEEDSTIWVYTKMIKKWPEKIELRYELSRIYYETGKYSEALKGLNEIEDEYGVSEPVSLFKEQIYLRLEMNDLAISEINKLLELMPEEVKYLGMLAELYSSIGKNEEALDIYNKIFEIDKNNGLAQLSFAEYYRNTGNYKEYFEWLEKAFKNNTLKEEKKIEVIIDYLTNEQELITHKDNIYKLIEILLEMYPEEYRTRATNADYLVKFERYEEALKEYDYVLKTFKNNYFIWEQSIFIENVLGNTEKVYEKSDEALKYFNDKPLIYLFKGNAAMQLGKYEEAVRVLMEGIKFATDNNALLVQFYAYLAESYRAMNLYKESDNSFEKALKYDPQNMMILNNYSYYLAVRSEDLEKAEKMSRETIKKEPDNSTYLDTYAWILFKSGKNKLALQYIEKAIKNNGSNDPEILEHYGDILEKIGRHDEAVKYWNKSVEMGNISEEVKEKIKENDR